MPLIFLCRISLTCNEMKALPPQSRLELTRSSKGRKTSESRVNRAAAPPVSARRACRRRATERAMSFSFFPWTTAPRSSPPWPGSRIICGGGGGWPGVCPRWGRAALAVGVGGADGGQDEKNSGNASHRGMYNRRTLRCQGPYEEGRVRGLGELSPCPRQISVLRRSNSSGVTSMSLRIARRRPRPRSSPR